MGLKDIDIETFKKDLAELKTYSPMFKAIRDDMKRRGNWKNRPRGDGFKPNDSRRKPVEPVRKEEKKIIFGNLLNGK